jgi:hypothetical protein
MRARTLNLKLPVNPFYVPIVSAFVSAPHESPFRAYFHTQTYYNSNQMRENENGKHCTVQLTSAVIDSVVVSVFDGETIENTTCYIERGYQWHRMDRRE